MQQERLSPPAAQDLCRQPEAWYPPGHQLLPQEPAADGSDMEPGPSSATAGQVCKSSKRGWRMQ